MKLKSLAAGLAVSAFTFGMAGAASAQSANSGLYISGGGGVNWVDSISDSGVKLEFDTGYTFQGAVGYTSGDYTDMGGFRIEGELSYTRNNNDKISAGGLSADIDGRVRQIGYMANAYWDFLPGSTLRPYVGVGMGAIDTKITGAGVSDSETEFAWRGMAGVSYHMNQNMALDLGYRHTRVEYDDTLKNNALVANLRFKF